MALFEYELCAKHAGIILADMVAHTETKFNTAKGETTVRLPKYIVTWFPTGLSICEHVSARRAGENGTWLNVYDCSDYACVVLEVVTE